MFSLAGPSRVLFDFDFITLGFVIELIQPSYVKGLHVAMCASFILSALYPGLDHFTGNRGLFFPQDMCGPFSQAPLSVPCLSLRL